MRTILFLALIVTMATGQSPEDYGIDSSAPVPDGLAVGSEAPLFSTTDHEGQKIDFAAMLEQGPLVVIFYRGQWCPVCNRYLQSFQDSLEVIKQTGAGVIAVAPETAPNVRKTIFKTELTIPVIADTSRAIMDAYEVSFDVTEDYEEKIKRGLSADIAKSNGAEQAFLPVPATYIISREGRIAWRQFDLNYKNRASVKQIAEQVRQLEAGK